MVTSPFHWNRCVVGFPFRVLQGSEVSGLMGSPFPVRPQRSPNAWPSRSSFLYPRPRTRLLGQSSRGVYFYSTAYPNVSALDLSVKGTSLGVSSPLQRSSRRESTSRWLPSRAPRFCRESIGRSHSADYGAACRFSQPHSGLFPLPHVLPFSDRWRSWGSTLQGVVPSTKPRMLIAAGVPSCRSSRRLRCPRS